MIVKYNTQVSIGDKVYNITDGCKISTYSVVDIQISYHIGVDKMENLEVSIKLEEVKDNGTVHHYQTTPKDIGKYYFKSIKGLKQKVMNSFKTY